jgi:ATP phosphoribosyltransferase
MAARSGHSPGTPPPPTRYFEDRGIAVKKVEYSWGATEVKASLPGVGAIVDITETGSSLRANKLRVGAPLGTC